MTINREGKQMWAEESAEKRRFYELGGVVSDVMTLLETTAREISQTEPLTGRQARQAQATMLTARHALSAVLAALNDEAR
jgi:hypothetical protein